MPNASAPRIASHSSLKVRGTSKVTTSSVTAKANTASLKPSSRDISCRRPANGIIDLMCRSDARCGLEQPAGLVEQYVDEHARHRDIQPDRQRPAGDPAVLREAG